MLLSTLKSIKQNLEIGLFPEYYKNKYFNTIANLDWKSIRTKNIENELLLICYFLDKDAVFIDVGANLGQYIFASSKLVKPFNTHAFEPNPKLFQRLSRIFPDVNVNGMALSNSESKLKFKIPFFNNREIHTRGTLKTEHIESDETDFKMIEVDVTTLDRYAEKVNIGKVSLIKIDVEGAEFEVLKGAVNVIRKFRPVLIVEIEQRHHSESIIKHISEIESSGNYKCFYFDTISQELCDDIDKQDILELQSPENHAVNRRFINNFIFLPRESFDGTIIETINQKISSNQF